MREVLLVGPRGVRLLCRIVGSRRERRTGFIGRESLSERDAIQFPNATSVHTFGMRFPILVIRLDASFRVMDARVVRPWRFIPPIRGARHVLECHEDVDLRVGDVVQVVRAANGYCTEEA